MSNNTHEHLKNSGAQIIQCTSPVGINALVKPRAIRPNSISTIE